MRVCLRKKCECVEGRVCVCVEERERACECVCICVKETNLLCSKLFLMWQLLKIGVCLIVKVNRHRGHYKKFGKRKMGFASSHQSWSFLLQIFPSRRIFVEIWSSMLHRLFAPKTIFRSSWNIAKHSNVFNFNEKLSPGQCKIVWLINCKYVVLKKNISSNLANKSFCFDKKIIFLQ